MDTTILPVYRMCYDVLAAKVYYVVVNKFTTTASSITVAIAPNNEYIESISIEIYKSLA